MRVVQAAACLPLPACACVRACACARARVRAPARLRVREAGGQGAGERRNLVRWTRPKFLFFVQKLFLVQKLCFLLKNALLPKNFAFFAQNLKFVFLAKESQVFALFKFSGVAHATDEIQPG